MTKRLSLWLGLCALVTALDQLSKKIVLDYFLCGKPLDLANITLCKAPIEVTSFFDFVFVMNKGAAFGFLANHPGWQRWFFVILAVVICTVLLFMMAKHQAEKLQPLAFALIIGGAIGNVIDRINHSAVVDFLSLHAGRHYWPAFNIADSAICLGVALMVLAQWRESKQQKQTETPT